MNEISSTIENFKKRKKKKAIHQLVFLIFCFPPFFPFFLFPLFIFLSFSPSSFFLSFFYPPGGWEKCNIYTPVNTYYLIKHRFIHQIITYQVKNIYPAQPYPLFIINIELKKFYQQLDMKSYLLFLCLLASAQNLLRCHGSHTL